MIGTCKRCKGRREIVFLNLCRECHTEGLKEIGKERYIRAWGITYSNGKSGTQQ